MAITITEKWSGRTKTRANQNGDTAQRIFTVVGATDDDNAMDALASSTWAFYVGQPYGDGSFLTCNNVTARWISAMAVHEVTASFAIGNYTAPRDPLTLPWSYDWKSVVDNQPFDRDPDGNPIVNSTRDAISGQTRTVTYKSLKITRNTAFYDYATWKEYENTVNADSITLTQPNGNSSTWDAGTIKCCTIEPAKAYTTEDKYVTMVFNFELYDASQINTTDPFQLHVLDQGSSGYYTGPTRGNLYNKDLTQVVCDKRLNGLGKPMDTTLLVGKEGKTPINFSGSPPAGSTIEAPTADATYLKYTRYKAVEMIVLLEE